VATAFDQVLRLFITADGRGLSAGLQKSLGEIKNFGSTAQRAFSGVQGAFAALGVAFSAGAVITGIKRTVDGLEDLAVSAKKTGVGVEELAKLRFAFDQADVPVESLNRGLRFLNRTLGEAQAGNQKARESLAALGVAATDTALPAMTKIADAIQKIPSAAERAAKLNEVFGKSWEDLVPGLAQGGAALKAAGDEIERFGGVPTQAAADAADKLNDNFANLSARITALTRNALTPLIQSLADVTGRFIAARNAGVGFLDSLDFATFDDLADKVKDAEKQLENLRKAREETIDAYQRADFKTARIPFIDAFIGKPGRDQIGEWIDNLDRQIADAEGKLKSYREALGNVTKAESGVGDAATAGLQDVADTAPAATTAVSKLASEYAKLVEQIKEGRAESGRAKLKDVKDSSVLDINRLRDQARSALDRGGEEGAKEAERFLKQAKAINNYLLESGQISKTYYQTQADLLLKLAEDGQKVLDNKPLNLPVAPDLEQAVQAGMLASEAAQSGVKPIVIPGVVQIGSQFMDESALPQTPDGRTIVSAAGLATGGPVVGPGTATSDSILARLSAGEFVVRAAAVKEYGVGLLDKLNRLALPKFTLPKFAAGGVVNNITQHYGLPSMSRLATAPLPAYAAGGPVGTPINLYLPDGRSFGMSAQPSVAKQLANILGTEVLKRGRR
jgi:hypothetical protein